MMLNPRKSFQGQLEELDHTLLGMGRQAEQMLSKVLQALSSRDIALADEVIAMDDEVDRLNLEIGTKSMQLIATQQPAARDLRIILAAIQIASDVERVADYAVDIALTAKRLADRPLFKPLVDIPRMQEFVKEMLRDSLEGFVTRDLELIKKMIATDDEVDHLYHYLHDELIDFMKKDSNLVDQAVHLLLIARYLERIADHITNIGERVYYVETGEIKELHK
ncbi:MAG: phosphate signaling complex protein PhoU [Actinobacteria bacterium]|nr:phosphate signaling complex protein PhoU [Actinomycetota bacterium]